MGDQPDAQESTAEMLQAVQRYFGPAAGAISKEILPTAQAQLTADQAVSPGYAKLQADLFREYAPQLAETGSRISDLEQRKAADTELAIANDQGIGLVTAAKQLQQILDPGAERNREEIATGISRLLGATDPTKLTANEREETSRIAERNRGYTNPRDVQAATENAMLFGDALQRKQSRFGEAIAAAAGAIPATRLGVNAFEVGTRRQVLPNTGNNNFVGAQSGKGSSAMDLGANFMNNVAGFQGQANAKKNNWLDITGGLANSFGSIAQGKFSF